MAIYVYLLVQTTRIQILTKLNLWLFHRYLLHRYPRSTRGYVSCCSDGSSCPLLTKNFHQQSSAYIHFLLNIRMRIQTENPHMNDEEEERETKGYMKRTCVCYSCTFSALHVNGFEPLQSQLAMVTACSMTIAPISSVELSYVTIFIPRKRSFSAKIDCDTYDHC
jgi:hypothetical protein